MTKKKSSSSSAKAVAAPKPVQDWAESERAVQAIEVPAGERPMLHRPGDGNPLPEFAALLGEALKDKGFYRRGKEVFTVDLQAGELELLTPRPFIDAMEQYVRIVKMRKDADGGVWPQVTSLNTEQSTSVLQMASFYKRLPEIKSVRHAPVPVVRQDGNIELLKAGYDPQTCIYTFDTGVVVNESMTSSEGLALIRKIVLGFRGLWGGNNEEERKLNFSILLAAMLGVYGRELLPLSARCPMFCFMANKQSAGKTTLAEFALYSVFHQIAATRASGDVAELEKTFHGKLYEGAPYVLFDNAKGTLESTALDAYLTTDYYEFRIMQIQRLLRVPNSAPVFLTGNNLELSKDLELRSLKILLHSDEADLRRQTVSEEEELTGDKMRQPEFRSLLCSALWAIVREWKAAGAPTLAPSRQFKFPRWARTFGGMVKFVGGTDILYLRQETNNTAVEMMRLLAVLVEAQQASSTGEEYSFDELSSVMLNKGIFAHEFDGEKMDRKFKGRMGRILGEWVNVNYTIEPLSRDESPVVMPYYPPEKVRDGSRKPEVQWLPVPRNWVRWRLMRLRTWENKPVYWVQPADVDSLVPVQ